MNATRHHPLAAITLAVCFSSPSFAIDWSAEIGNWATPGHWSPAVVPNLVSGPVVNVFNNGHAQVTSQVPTIANLFLGSAFGGEGGTVSILDGADLTVLGDVALGFDASGTLNIGSFTNGGNAGSLTLSPNAAFILGPSAVVNFNQSNSFTFTGSPSSGGDDVGEIFQRGTGVTTLAGDGSAFNGTVHISAGTLRLGNGGNSLGDRSAVLISGGTLHLGAANETIGILTGSGGTIDLFNGTGRILTINQAASGTYTGGFSGAGGGLVKKGIGTLTLRGAMNFTGLTTVSEGTLELASNFILPGDVRNDATLIFNPGAGNFLYAGLISGTGNLVKSGPGNLLLTRSHAYTGSTTVNGGILRFGTNINALNDTNPVIVNGGTLQLESNETIGPLSGLGGVILFADGNDTLTINQSSDGTFAGDIGGFIGSALVKNGGGTLTLTGSNTLVGLTTISGGTLVFGNNINPLSSLPRGDIRNDGLLVFNNASPVNYTRVISGAGRVEKKGFGAVILTGENTYTGSTTNSSGVFQLGDGVVSGNLSGDIRNDGSLIFNVGDDIAYAGVISGNGRLLKRGPGTLTLTGTNTFTAETRIQAGTLQLGSGGDVLGPISVFAEGGTLALGHDAETIARFSVVDQGAVAFEAASATEFERLLISGDVTLSGNNTFRFSLTGGYEPVPGTVFDVMDWLGSLTGTFATLDLPSGIIWDTTKLHTDGSISALAVPEPSAVMLIALGTVPFALRRRARSRAATTTDSFERDFGARV